MLTHFTLEQIWQFFDDKTRQAPRIQFVGVFDTVKAVRDNGLYDIELNDSTQHLRHALALHEDRKYMAPESIFPEAKGRQNILKDRTFLQAWFVGAHIDIGGSAAKAGLALYPLQWMLLESQSQGLSLGFVGPFGGRTTIENPLDVVFPNTSELGKGEDIWTSRSVNGVTTRMQDLRMVHDHPKYSSRYHIQLNGRRTLLKQKRRPFDNKGNVNGFFSWAAQGTIIHPSVYFLLDECASIAFATQELGLQTAIEEARELMLGASDGKIIPGFWMGREIVAREMPDALRVLVCGNTGVGKSTLINKVFGVELTESHSRERGIHDVAKEITFEGRPDLILHDSGGFEAGRTEEFDKIEAFLKQRSEAGDLKQRLHVIWFCLPLTDNRPKQAATGKLFEAVSKYAEDIPLVIVATKSDEFANQKAGEYRKRVKKDGGRVIDEEVDAHAEAEVQKRAELIGKEMLEIPGGRVDACVAVSAEDDQISVESLTKTTAQCFSDERVRLLYIRAQTSSIELKVSSAMTEVLHIYKAILGSATGTAFIPLGASSTRYGAAIDVCRRVLQHFGLPNVSAETAIEVVRANVWEDLGNHFAMAWAEAVAGFGLFLTVFSGGMPFFLASTLINIPIIIPATTRLFLMLAADLIIILARSFKDAAERQVGQPEQRDLLAAARAYRKFAPEVHREIGKVVPRRNMFASFQVGKVSKQFRKTVEEYRIKMIEDLASERPAKYSVETDSSRDSFTMEDSKDLGKIFEVEELYTETGGMNH